MKRTDFISWDEYFMGLALLSAKRSKDPSTQVGACIVSPTNRVLSVGYNGFAFGCSDDSYSWERDGDFLETKYPYVVHAELNAILNNRGVSLENAKLYVALFPCNECAKAIIQSGIKEVIYLSNKYADTDVVKASKRMFESAGVRLTELVPSVKKIELSFDVDDI
ncbi:dCMP deaminase family protein [Clostridium sardiniense]|uniref:dCMP deaminase family protein n=1 Tax=Clostridium sardiniense TaxID=29369 RepID=A0ABS7KY45_CLOSR|nr:dCMP deaminase family protein [Clostridium sardiniense]MBM7835376.1 dCMP deaminase [Clostridium sardiniense]MBY0755735.1 dCMP deaminase family protein [Clostridium sardiniense]MDQ0460038.1 dCMP deaminase [Clostridium sardiniense]